MPLERRGIFAKGGRSDRIYPSYVATVDGGGAAAALRGVVEMKEFLANVDENIDHHPTAIFTGASDENREVFKHCVRDTFSSPMPAGCSGASMVSIFVKFLSKKEKPGEKSPKDWFLENAGIQR